MPGQHRHPAGRRLSRTDTWDNVTKLTDDNGSDTDYAYDDLNRLSTKTYEDTKTVSFTYDDADNVTQIIDQNGTDIDQGYDALYRLIGRDVTLATGVGGDTEEDFAYDALGRLTEAKDDDSIVQMTYDSLSRVLTEKQGPNPFGTAAKTVTYTYDAGKYGAAAFFPHLRSLCLERGRRWTRGRTR